MSTAAVPAFTKDADWIQRNLKREMYVTGFNLDESQKVAIETDPEVGRAIDAMPKAKALLDTARNSQVAYATRAVLMRVELRRAKEYVQQNKLSEAAAVIHELAANTADADAKADLERQAGHILHVAEQNRQIDVYNQAIGQVNGGDYRAAMKTLDALLASATDDGVIRDAKRLQERLKGRGRTGSGRSQ